MELRCTSKLILSTTVTHNVELRRLQSLSNVGAPRVSYLLTQTFEFPFAAAYFRVAKFRTLKNSLPPFYTSPRLLVPLQ